MWSGVAADGQNAAGDLRVHGLDAAVEHLGKAGDFGDVADRHAGFAQIMRAVPPVEMISAPSSLKPARKIDDTGLVGDADEDASQGHQSHDSTAPRPQACARSAAHSPRPSCSE